MFQELCKIEHVLHESEDFVKRAKRNEDYRVVALTTKEMQVVLMALMGSEFIPKEIHENVSQLIYVVEGTAMVVLGDRSHIVKTGHFFMIPSGHEHTVLKHNSEWLKLISFYSPPEHPVDRHDIRQP